MGAWEKLQYFILALPGPFMSTLNDVLFFYIFIATLTFMHWGEMIQERVDERGEVALLTRNIVIRGEMLSECPEDNGNCKTYDYDTFGGHVKVMPGFTAAHIEGVELYNVGQQTDLGMFVKTPILGSKR